MRNSPSVLCIVGPTATGKTSLSVELAKRQHGEIVSADAVAVYRRLDIGSAKPTLEERQGIPHHMIDCAQIDDTDFTVSRFRECARSAINEILSRGKLPIVVGGSGLYSDAIFTDMHFSAPSDPALRTSLEREYDRDRNAFFELLRSFDATTAERLHPNDKKRVIRAVEVFRLTGKTFSELNRSFSSAQANDGTYRIVRVGLNMNREELYRRIELRVDEMIALLVDEGRSSRLIAAQHVDKVRERAVPAGYGDPVAVEERPVDRERAVLSFVFQKSVDRAAHIDLE